MSSAGHAQGTAGLQQCTSQVGGSIAYLGWRPGHGEEQVQGDLQLLCTVHVAVAGGVGDDGLPHKLTCFRAHPA